MFLAQQCIYNVKATTYLTSCWIVLSIISRRDASKNACSQILIVLDTLQEENWHFLWIYVYQLSQCKVHCCTTYFVTVCQVSSDVFILYIIP